jgi:ubiquinone/menaquinone biosynthesis C-methylase UbiE
MTTQLESIKQHYQHPEVARSYDRERFSGLVGRTFDSLEKRAIRQAIRRARQTIPSPVVLDVPCGTGRITELFLDQGLQVMGGDISRSMLEIAQSRCVRFIDQVSFRQLDLDGLDCANASFDLVSCIRLFHHLDTETRERYLSELARVSRQFVLINVSLSTPYYRFRRRVKRWLGQGVSKTSSSWTEIRREIGGAGLTIEAYCFALRYFSEDLVLLLRKSA